MQKGSELVEKKGCETIDTYLVRQFKLRLMADIYFSRRDWAKEIGIPMPTLNALMLGKVKVKETRSKTINAMVQFFGPEVLPLLGIQVPDHPRNQ